LPFFSSVSGPLYRESSYKIAARFCITSAAGELKKGNSYTIKLSQKECFFL